MLPRPPRSTFFPYTTLFRSYRGQRLEKFAPERIIHFRFPDPRDPYTAGLSPLRACFEQAAQASRYAAMKRIARSEEHTSELQSRQYLVCRLLLEKKKQGPTD